jgi:ABC-type Na+ transport system ATPase subunit NatA
MSDYILSVDNLHKIYTHGRFHKEVTFSLRVDMRFAEAAIIGVMGANGAGKTTLFEIITGSNPPTSGRVYCLGQNIHNVKYNERDRLVIHYHQSYQVRRLKWTKPNLMLEAANSNYPIIHLFDEPQFNTQDGYIGFMLDFFKSLRRSGKLIFVSLHPTEIYHLQLVREICEQFIFVHHDQIDRSIRQYRSWEAFVGDDDVRQYLGANLEAYERQTMSPGQEVQ